MIVTLFSALVILIFALAQLFFNYLMVKWHAEDRQRLKIDEKRLKIDEARLTVDEKRLTKDEKQLKRTTHWRAEMESRN